jgi:hypothetical protein
MRYLIMASIMLGTVTVMPACKAKSCDASNNVTDGNSKSSKRNSSLFSKKEKRSKKW